MQVQTRESFAFKYVVNLGNQIGNIFVDQTTDPYVEASKFCAKYGLPTIVITMLGDQIRKEIQEEKTRICSSYLETEVQSKKRSISRQKTQKTQPKTLQTEQRENLSSQNQDQFSKINLEMNSLKVLRSQNLNTFDNLYNDHRSIEKKKQLQRKKSFERITFRPQINVLSREIVCEKRRLSSVCGQIIEENRNRHSNCSQQNVKPSKKLSTVSRDKDQYDIYQRSLKYLSKSQQKRNKIRKCIQDKLMQGCTFRPKIITTKWR